jgi:SAM-dependent methyltransferase
MTAPAKEADRTLKANHRAMWALGDYPVLAADIISDLGQILVGACGMRPGDRVLDVAAGSGNAAIPAARAGASVVACDLTPELLAAGQRQAEREGIELEWREADAEALPFGDGEFDVVMSCLGVMFAPRHRVSAGELVRVCRPGGTIGLLSWTPEGFIGQMFAAMKPYAPPPNRRRCGAVKTTSARCSVTGSPISPHNARQSGLTSSPAPRTSATTSKRATARPSPPTGASPMIRSEPPPSTATSPALPAATIAAQ